jgi:hypothetical protein
MPHQGSGAELSIFFERYSGKGVQMFMRVFFLLLLLACQQLMAQSIEQTQKTAPVAKASGQAGVWQEMTLSQPDNSGAWLNYYIWTSRDESLPENQRRTLLSDVFTRAAARVSGSAEFRLMTYLHSGKKDSASLLQALRMTPGRPLAYPYVIQWKIMQESSEGLDSLCRKFSRLSPLAEEEMEYHSNVLQSAEKNATLFAAGLTDLVPLSVLQHAYGIRTDITLKFFDGETIPGPGDYLCLSLGKDVIAKFPGGVYSGLLIRLKGTKDSELKKHIEEDFSLGWLKTHELNGRSTGLFSNYLPSFLILYNYYVEHNDGRSAELGLLIGKIAKAAGFDHSLIKNDGH